tara:strand:+ start:412 stop:660 length:249 start_codon:yes stop_codon:yes gene_type:complete
MAKTETGASQEFNESPFASFRELTLDGAIGGFVGTLDRFVDFVSMNGHLTRGLNPQTNFVAADFNNNDFDIVIDDDAFVLLS